LNEQDREKLLVTVTNQWQGKVCASPTVRELAPQGLFLHHESGAFWCGWAQLPAETRDKYQAIVAEAQRNSRSARVVTDVSAPASSDPKSSKPPIDYGTVYTGSTTVPTTTRVPATSHSDSGKTEHVKGYYKKDGTYVRSHTRRPSK
jgi:hypothetical protein